MEQVRAGQALMRCAMMGCGWISCMQADRSRNEPRYFSECTQCTPNSATPESGVCASLVGARIVAALQPVLDPGLRQRLAPDERGQRVANNGKHRLYSFAWPSRVDAVGLMS